MQLTQKDYEAIARIIRDVEAMRPESWAAIHDIIKFLAGYFSSQDGRFKLEQFLIACTPENKRLIEEEVSDGL